MAHMIPDEPPAPGPGARAERQLFEVLRDGLSEEYFVYHRLHYVEEEKAREGEADFLVLHPKLGMLVIECKGYGIKRTGGGEWIRDYGGGRWEPLRASPFQQAQWQVKDLVKKLTPRVLEAFPKLERFPLVHGHAVAFPFSLVGDVNLPLDVPRMIVYDASDFDHIAGRVMSTFSFWAKAAGGRLPGLGESQFRRFRRKILHPTLDLVSCLGASVAAERRTLVKLTQEQAWVVEGWLENPRLRVRGGAGTGKTVLALCAAERLAEEGKSVLLLCFNKALGEYLDRTVKGWELEPGGGRAVASTFHGLCINAHHLTEGKPPEMPTDREAEAGFWNEEAPLFLLQALEAGKQERFDAVVVDEGQDFAASWWTVVEDLLKDKDQGRLLIFYDSSQNIFERKSAVPDYPSFKLTRNFRNTQEIAWVVRDLGRVEMQPYERCPRGEPPLVEGQPSPAKLKTLLGNLVKKLLEKERLRPEQITVLSPHKRENSCLAGLSEVAGVPLADLPSEREGAVLHTTIGAFKGLESDVVIMVDIDPEDARCNLNARYVAASRARHLLYVYAKGDWMG